MAKVICVVPVAPIRAEGSHRAEMVSQILFGETATIIHETKDFYQIQMHQYEYEGWCQKLQLQILPEGAAIITKGYTVNWVNSAVFNGQAIQLPMGTPIVSDAHANFELTYTSAILDSVNNKPTQAAIEALASKFLGIDSVPSTQLIATMQSRINNPIFTLSMTDYEAMCGNKMMVKMMSKVIGCEEKQLKKGTSQ